MRAIDALALTALSVVVTSGPTLAGPLAQVGSKAQRDEHSFTAEVRHEDGPGLLPADRAYLRAGTNQFAFLIPDGLKLQSWGDGRVVLVSRDYGCQISFRILIQTHVEKEELSPNFCSQWILAQHPGAKIVKTYPTFADSRPGSAYEFDFAGLAGAVRRGLTTFLLSQNWTLEIALECGAENFEVARRQFTTVMLTFRSSDAKGQLHISPLSDKI